MDRIQIEDLGWFAYRADGCGHRAIYQCADNSQESGTWCIMEREEGVSSSATMPPPGPSRAQAGPGSRPEATPTASSSGGEANDVAVSGPDGLRARLDERADRILTCLGQPNAAVHLSWGGELTGVRLDVLGVEDPQVIACARAAFGAVSMSAGAPPGELLHALAR